MLGIDNSNLFQSTHPLRGATSTGLIVSGLKQFQSTHPLRGATGPGQHLQRDICISIHAPLAGCDSAATSLVGCTYNFNPRTPCGVRLDSAYAALSGLEEFQSTHPLRGATSARPRTCQSSTISIHAPLAGCDTLTAAVAKAGDISIHAPLAGCDARRGRRHFTRRHFNPRTPCWVRLKPSGKGQGTGQFQSTHPLRGATTTVIQCRCTQGFQSTHPLRGATRKMRARMRAKNFNPRTPCGVRLLLLSSGCLPSYFNPRTPCGVRHYSIAQSAWQENFNPRTPCGVRLWVPLMSCAWA